MSIGSMLRRERLLRSFTQKEMACALSVPTTTYASWERDLWFPSMRHMVLLQHAFPHISKPLQATYICAKLNQKNVISY